MNKDTRAEGQIDIISTVKVVSVDRWRKTVTLQLDGTQAVIKEGQTVDVRGTFKIT